MEEEDKKAERDLEILKKYHKKETKSVKNIFITLFLFILCTPMFWSSNFLKDK